MSLMRATSVALVILLFSSLAFAQAPPATNQVPDSPTVDDVMKRLTGDELQILVSKSIDKLKVRITESKSLSPEERSRIGAIIERDADKIEDQLDKLIFEASKLNQADYYFGAIITLGADLSINLPINHVVAGPGGEFGWTFFVKENARENDKIRAVFTTVLKGAVELQSDRTVLQNKSDLEGGLHIKILWGSDQQAKPIKSLREYAGTYTGAGGEGAIGIAALSGRFYGKNGSCKYMAFAGCRTKIVGVTMNFGRASAPLQAAVSEMWLAFWQDNHGRGWNPW